VSKRISFVKNNIIFATKYFNLDHCFSIKMTQRGSVILSKRKKDGKRVVLKIASKSVYSTESDIYPSRSSGLLNEITILEKINGHKNFSKLISKVINDEIVASLIDFVPGKDLFCVPNNYKRQVIISLIKILFQLHSIGFTHGDIQPKNFLFSAKNPFKLTLIDFELSKRITDHNKLYPGKTEYLSPENAFIVLTKGIINNSVAQDIYSLGVTILSMLAGNSVVSFNKNNLSRTEKLKLLHKKNFYFNITKVHENFLPLAKIIISILSKKTSEQPQSIKLFAKEIKINHLL